MFGLESRMISSVNQINDNILYKEIHWENVNRIMNIEREKSMSWLINALEE